MFGHEIYMIFILVENYTLEHTYDICEALFDTVLIICAGVLNLFQNIINKTNLES